MMPLPSVDLNKLFKRHEQVFVAFSGGKDSTALVELCEPWRDQVTLVSVDVEGASFPHMIDRVESYGKRFRLHWLRSDRASHWAQWGLPTRVAPFANINAFGRGVHHEPKMQPWQTCCNELRSAPLVTFFQSQPNAVCLHGQRLSDIAPGSYPSSLLFEQGADCGGFLIYAPLRDWSEADVLAFLAGRGVELPIQYRYGTTDFSLDCSNCPAMLMPQMPQRIKFMQDHYPDQLGIALSHLRTTHAGAAKAIEEIGEMISLAAGGGLKG